MGTLPAQIERRASDPDTPVDASGSEIEIVRRSTPEFSLKDTRILYIVPQPFYDDRGSPIAVLQVARAMSDLGMQVDIMAFPPGRSVEIKNLRIFRSGGALRIRNVPIGFSMRKVFLDFALLFALRARLKTENYACIHALEDGIYVALASGAVGKIPIIYDMHSCIPEQLSTHLLFRNRLAQWILRKFESYALQKSTIISCSVGLKDYIKDKVPETMVAEWTFSDPANDSTQQLDEPARLLRKELGVAPDAAVILYAGNFQDYQGVDILIEAIPSVRQAHPNAVVILLGASNDDNAGALESSADGSLIVCPRQPREQVPTYLHMAQILVSPRKCGENLPLKLFEYLVAAKPIVATDNRHHRMVLHEDRAVFADSTSAGIAQALNGLLDDPEEMSRLAAAAKAYSDEKLGWKNFVQSVSDLYTNALRRPIE